MPLAAVCCASHGHDGVDYDGEESNDLPGLTNAMPVTSVRQTLTVQSPPPLTVVRQMSVGWNATALMASRWL
jgi:hypothetical protein